MDIQFVTSVAVITPDPSRSRKLYLETFGLPLADDSDPVTSTVKMSRGRDTSASGP